MRCFLMFLLGAIAMFALLFLIGTLTTIANANDPVLVCWDNEGNDCKCKSLGDRKLKIDCSNVSDLTTTKIAVPDSKLEGILSVDIIFKNTGITQLKNPLLSEQLSSFVDELTFEGTPITEIEKNVFDELPKLEKLSFENCQINDDILNSGWLTSTLGKTLKYLYLDDNKITKITNGTFKNLGALRDLYLKYNQLQEIDNGAFDSLSSLKNLYLSDNKIHYIENEAFEQLLSLKSLWLDNNDLHHIEIGTFNKLASLEDLILSRNKIKHIEPVIFNGLSFLKKLLLISNETKHIKHGELAGLNKLKALWLDNNRIQKINNETFIDLNMLTELYLNNNPGLKLDEKIFGSNKSINLNKLNLNGTGIKQLSDDIRENLSEFAEIILDDN